MACKSGSSPLAFLRVSLPASASHLIKALEGNMDLENVKDDLMDIYHDKNGPHDITLKETALAANDSIVDLQLRITTLEAALIEAAKTNATLEALLQKIHDDPLIVVVDVSFVESIGKALEGKG